MSIKHSEKICGITRVSDYSSGVIKIRLSGKSHLINEKN